MKRGLTYTIHLFLWLSSTVAMSQWQTDTSGHIVHSITNETLNRNWIDAQCHFDIDSATIQLQELKRIDAKNTKQKILVHYFDARISFLRGQFNTSISTATKAIRQWEFDEDHHLTDLYKLMSEVFLEKGYPDKAFE